MDDFFSLFDTDNDGLISFDEFCNLLRHHKAGRTQDVMRAYFAKLDTNGDGLIDVDEFEKWWAQADD